ncbi:MAG: hypothetical protein ACREP2_13145, partial [Rhodanobacteraceae bacterium]
MAARIHVLPTVRTGRPAPAATALLQASGRLWAAPDLESVVTAAGALLDELVPGTRLERCSRRDSGPVAVRSSGS